MSRRRLPPALAALAPALLLALLLAALARLAPPAAALESRARDLVHAFAGPRAPISDRVVLVTVRESTLARLPYRSPLDRGFLAETIEALAAARPAAIGLDILFDQPTEPEKDARLRETLARHAALPVIPAAAGPADGLTEAQAAWMTAFLDGLPRGHVALLRDADTAVARGIEPLRAGPDGAPAPAFAIALAAAAGAPAPAAEGPVALAYAGPEEAGAARFWSFPAELASRLPPSRIEGRVVLIGVDLAGQDRHATPLAAASGPESDRPGVELHAQLVEQLLEGRRLAETGFAADAAAAMAAAALGVAALSAPFGVRARVLLGLAALAAAALAPAAALAFGGLRGPVAPPVLACLAGAGIAGIGRWRAETEAKRRIRDAFGRYLSPAVVAEIAENPDALRLNGERREITCVFTDVEGFTALCESEPPERLCGLLNRYLDGMTGVVFAHGATLDKFVGDAVVCFLGAPSARPDHAAQGVRLALALDAFAESFRARAAAEGLRFGATRIGVNTGIATVGNFGGERFFDYTAIGDAVNLAARLEGANKTFGTRILVSGETARRAGAEGEGYRLRPLGELRVVGRDAYAPVFEPLTPASPAAASMVAWLRAYDLLARAPAEAAAAFATLAAGDPGDRAAAFHAARLARGESGVRVTLGSK